MNYAHDYRGLAETTACLRIISSTTTDIYCEEENACVLKWMECMSYAANVSSY